MSESPDRVASSAPAAHSATAAIDALTANARAKAERYREMSAQAQQVSVSASSPDEMVSVVIDSNGNVTDLRITDAVRGKAGREVAAAVLSTMRRAQAKLPEKLAEVMHATIGQDEATVETIVGNYRARFPEPVDPDAPAEQRGGDRGADAPDSEQSSEENDWAGRSLLKRPGRDGRS